MLRAYSGDIGWIAIGLHRYFGFDTNKVALLFPVTVRRYLQKHRAFGELGPSVNGRPLGKVEIHSHEDFVLIKATLEQQKTY